MNIVQQRSRTEGTGSSMGEMSMGGGGPGNHAHVSVTVLHNMEKITSMSFENVFILVLIIALSADTHRLQFFLYFGCECPFRINNDSPGHSVLLRTQC